MHTVIISMPMFVAFVFSLFPNIEMHVFLFSCVGVFVLFSYYLRVDAFEFLCSTQYENL